MLYIVKILKIIILLLLLSIVKGVRFGEKSNGQNND